MYKKKSKYLFFMILSLFCLSLIVNSLHGDSNNILEKIKQEINEINTIKLYSYSFYLTGSDTWVAIDINDENSRRNSNIQYPYPIGVSLDDKKRIRKIDISVRHPEGGGDVMLYYDKNGELCFSLFYTYSPENYCNGSIIFYKNKSIEDNVVTGFPSEPVKKRVYNKEIIYSCLSENDVSIKNKVDLRSIDANNVKVALSIPFNKPEKNIEYYINANFVNVREKPTINSRIIGQLHTLDWITILSVVPKEERIKNVGTSNWYQIKAVYKEKITGYVFGTFIGPPRF